jgi:hypothetical protein
MEPIPVPAVTIPEITHLTLSNKTIYVKLYPSQ